MHSPPVWPDQHPGQLQQNYPIPELDKGQCAIYPLNYWLFLPAVFFTISAQESIDLSAHHLLKHKILSPIVIVHTNTETKILMKDGFPHGWTQNWWNSLEIRGYLRRQ